MNAGRENIHIHVCNAGEMGGMDGWMAEAWKGERDMSKLWEKASGTGVLKDLEPPCR